MFNKRNFVNNRRIRNDFNIIFNFSKIRNDIYVKIVEIVSV